MKIKIGLIAVALIFAAQTSSAQMISPRAGESYSTPTIVPVVLTNGCLINNVRLYKYRTDAAGVEHREFFQQVNLGNVSNVYQLYPHGFPFHCSCGYYDVAVAYTLDGSNYMQVTSGRIKILTDLASVTIRQPTMRSVAVRGTAMTISWDIMAKPGQEGVLIGVQTPDGASMWDFADLQVTHDIPIFTNQFTWIVPTNTSYSEGRVSFPDGLYALQIIPDETGGGAVTYFRIDSEATIPATLTMTNQGTQSTLIVGSQQAVPRYWWIESSTNLHDWSLFANTPVFAGTSITIDRTNDCRFFRTRAVE